MTVNNVMEMHTPCTKSNIWFLMHDGSDHHRFNHLTARLAHRLISLFSTHHIAKLFVLLQPESSPLHIFISVNLQFFGFRVIGCVLLSILTPFYRLLCSCC
ncbi:hypothetical protein BDV26DRAFT_107114 [Aspergillus bertholletiae]|uniref:Uncharacterized protein n=1 Tax=Aspergillus bertholletiae TaxID=1226010 RepID=A0A5N7ATR5_9EURO|nr:hypothetical protein BDV26DRAFT_107114 [Aspergillus bertholletiae]